MPHALNDDVELYYETFGFDADPALLMVNGLGSQCINFRSEWCEMFAAAGFFVIRFDNRDVGWSTWFDERATDPSVAAYTLSDMATDAVAVLDAAGVGRAHVLGFSMGGAIVQVLAIDHADRLLTMTSVMSSTGDPDAGHSSEDALALLLSPAPSTREEYIQRQFEGIRTWGTPAAYDEDRLRAVHGEAYDRAHHPAGQARQLQAVVASPARRDALGRVTVPTLVIHGDQDRLIDLSGGRHTAESVPGARFEIIEGMGHDYPPLVWEPIVALVAEHAGLSSGHS